MTSWVRHRVVPLTGVLLACTLVATGAEAQSPAERTIALPFVGSGRVYIPEQPTSHVVLFLSGDGGWNQGVVDMARRIAREAIVIGVSYPALARAAAREPDCWYPAGDLELLSRVAERTLNLPDYSPPVLAGYSSGASLVYATLAGAPQDTFQGGLSLGFCPDLEVARPLCGAGSWQPPYDPRKHVNLLPPSPALSNDWFLLHGTADQVCAHDATRAFAETIGRAHFLSIDHAGHGFSRPSQWATAFDGAVSSLLTDRRPEPVHAPAPAAARDVESALEELGLPLEFRWALRPRAVLVFLSGDGGWASLDDGVAQRLSERGVSVVGFNSLRFFWQAKTRREAAAALERVVAVLGDLHVPLFVGGYSFGAEVAAVALTEWSPIARARLAGLALVAPGESASFEIHPLDWLRSPPTDPTALVVPALHALALPVVCIRGQDDDGGACAGAAQVAAMRVTTLPGSHHFHGNFSAVAEAVLRFTDAVLTTPERGEAK